MIVESAEGVIVRSIERVIILLTWGMLDCDVGMISEVFVIEVVIAVIVSEVVPSVSYTVDIRAVCRGASSCWPAAASNSCALQA